MEKDVVKELLINRVQQNKKIFTNKEYFDIMNNIDNYTKVYVLGIIDINNITKI